MSNGIQDAGTPTNGPQIDDFKRQHLSHLSIHGNTEGGHRVTSHFDAESGLKPESWDFHPDDSKGVLSHIARSAHMGESGNEPSVQVELARKQTVQPQAGAETDKDDTTSYRDYANAREKSSRS